MCSMTVASQTAPSSARGQENNRQSRKLSFVVMRQRRGLRVFVISWLTRAAMSMSRAHDYGGDPTATAGMKVTPDEPSTDEHGLRRRLSTSLRFYDDFRRNSSLQDGAVIEISNSSRAIRVSLPANSTADEKSFRLCEISSLMPYTNLGLTQLFYGTYSIAASVLAMHHFNDRNDVLVPELGSDFMRNCDLKFTMSMYNTDISPMTASTLLIKDVIGSGLHSLSHPQPCAILGCTRSASTALVASFAGVNDILQVSSGSTSRDLDNVNSYPLFGRTAPSDAGKAKAAVQYLRNVMNATYCSIIYVRDEYGSAFADDFIHEANSMVPRIKLARASFAPNDKDGAIRAVQQLKLVGYRYYFALIPMGLYKVVMREAVKLGVAGPGTFWLHADQVDVGTKYDPAVDGDLIKAGFGTASIYFYIEQSHAFQKEWSKFNSDEDLEAYFFSKTPNNTNLTGYTYTPYPGPWELLHYDAMISIGMSACAAESEFFNGSEAFNAFKSLDFTGASGSVRFNEATGTRDVRTIRHTIDNLLTSQPDKDGMVTMITKRYATQNIDKSNESEWKFLWTTVDNVPFVYSDGATKPPDILPELEVDLQLVPPAILAIGLIFAGIVMMSSVGWMVWTLKNRRSFVVTMAQPEFLVMLCIGTFIMGASVIPMALQQPIDKKGLDIACMAVPWLLSTGWCVSFSALFSKIYRMNTILNNSIRFRRFQLKAKDVILPFVLFFTMNLTVLISWTKVAPMKYKIVPMASYDMYGRSVQFYTACDAENKKLLAVHASLIVIVNLGSLVFSNIQALRSRIHGSLYDESKPIAISMVIILQTVVLAVPVLLVSYKSRNAYFLIRAVVVSIISGAVLIPTFAPKYVRLKRNVSNNRNSGQSQSAMLRSKKPGIRSSEHDSSSSLNNNGVRPFSSVRRESSIKSSTRYSNNKSNPECRLPSPSLVPPNVVATPPVDLQNRTNL